MWFQNRERPHCECSNHIDRETWDCENKRVRQQSKRKNIKVFIIFVWYRRQYRIMPVIQKAEHSQCLVKFQSPFPFWRSCRMERCSEISWSSAVLETVQILIFRDCTMNSLLFWQTALKHSIIDTTLRKSNRVKAQNGTEYYTFHSRVTSSITIHSFQQAAWAFSGAFKLQKLPFGLERIQIGAEIHMALIQQTLCTSFGWSMDIVGLY